MIDKRSPQQARGHIRYQRIINSAVNLMRKLGSSNFTMQDLAAESDTSIGSLYHFFRYKKDLLSELASKHEKHLKELYVELNKVPQQFWETCTADQIIEESFLPALQYMARNSDFLILIREGYYDSSRDEDITLQASTFYRKILKVRMPKVSDERINLYTQMLMALPAGPFGMKQQKLAFSETIILREIPRAVASYLSVIEILEKD